MLSRRPCGAVSKAMLQKSGKVVVVSQQYPTDHGTTAAIMAAIATRVAQDDEVLVRSGTAGSVSPALAGQPEVEEIRNWMPAKAALIKRATAEILFRVRIFAALLMKLRRGDVVLTVPAPFMLPYALAAAARLKRAKSVLIMHDLYPEVLVAAGLLKPASMPAKVMRGLNALMFRALNAVVIIDRKSTRLNCSHQIISYAVFCLKKKKYNAPQITAITGVAQAIMTALDLIHPRSRFGSPGCLRHRRGRSTQRHVTEACVELDR